MAHYVVSSGVTSTLHLNSGDTMSVLSSGVSLRSVLAGGFEFVSAHGRSVSDTISSGGVLSVEIGGVASRTLVASVGSLVIGDSLGGGVAKGVRATVLNGGQETVYAGSSVVDTTISGGGQLLLEASQPPSGDFASALSTTVLGVLSVGADGLATGVAVHGGGRVVLEGSKEINQNDNQSGYVPILASAGDVRVSRGGIVTLMESALNTDGVVLGGGRLVVSGSLAVYGLDPSLAPEDSGTTVSSGGQEFVDTFGVAIGTVVSSGGQLIASSGSVSGARILAGGALWIEAFAFEADDPVAIEGVTVSSGASLRLGSALIGDGATLVDDSQQASTTTFDGVTIKAGAFLTLDEVTIGSGGTLSLGAGKALSSTTVSLGGALYGPGELGGGHGAAASTTAQGLVKDVALADADLTVSSGGRTISVSIDARSTEQVLSGAASTDDVVHSGGLAVVQAGATLRGMTVRAGGVVELGAVLVGKTDASEVVGAAAISSGGVLAESGALIAYDAPVVSSGGVLEIHSGGFAIAARVFSGGEIEGSGKLSGASIVSGGLVSGVEIASGASLDEITGEVADVRVDAATLLDVETFASGVAVSGGVASLGDGLTAAAMSMATIHDGGGIVVAADAEIYAVGVSSGARLILSGGAGSAIMVHAGGLVSGAGLASGNLYGATSDDGVVTDMTVQSGGVLDVLSGGEATSSLANSAASIVIASGGLGRDLAVASGGALVDDGVLSFDASATLSGALSGGGVLKVTGGAFTQAGDASGFTGRTVISGGTVKLSTATGLGAGSIAFEAAGGASAALILTVASRPKTGKTFAETLVDLNTPSESLDLAHLAFVSGATAKLVGDTLTLADGAYSARFTLAGATAAGYAVASDGHGGTLVTAGGSAAMGFAQAMAAFEPKPGGANAPAVSSGGGGAFPTLARQGVSRPAEPLLTGAH